MLYYIFTVDGDWREYFDVSLTEKERFPRKEHMRELIRREMLLAERCLNGRFVHFIHTSPLARTFFLKEPFMGLWKRIVEKGGDIGIHCHEDDPGRAYYFRDVPRMRKVIFRQVGTLRKKGLDVCAYRGGYLAFDPAMIPVLEENGLLFDFSCEPGRYLVIGGQVVSDWRGARTSLYRMSYRDYRREGNSRVLEVPVGAAGGSYLYLEKSGEEDLKRVACELRHVSEKKSRDIIVSVLTHSYQFDTPGKLGQIEQKINRLKEYGNFISLKELSDLRGREERYGEVEEAS